MFPRFFILLASLVMLAFLPQSGEAITLDWDTVTWTPGALSGSFDVDPLKPGNDITVTLSGDTGQFVPKGTTTVPAIGKLIEGGLTPVENALILHVSLANQTQRIIVTVDFSAQYTQGVNNVSFTIFDVDFSSNSFQDQIRTIRALSIDGVTLIAPTITVGTAATLSGTGINQVVNGTAGSPDTGAGSGAGNVTISFGTAAIKSFTFTYGSGSNAPASPSNQGIALHDIYFTAVPEINPAWISFLSCLAASGFALRHRFLFPRK